MHDDTSTDRFSDDEARILASVLDEIIPPSADGRLPGAGALGVAAHVDRVLRTESELRGLIAQGLRDLDAAARQRHGRDFAELARRDKVTLLNEQGFVLALTLHAYVGYYQDARVVEALGLEARAPHPKGYEMAPNDLTLLDAVRRRPKLYRAC